MVRFFYNSSIFYKNPREGQVDTSYVLMKKHDRDSIALLVQQLLEVPAKPKDFCTDYVGSLYLFMRRSGDQLEQTSRYSSVCDWSKLSDTTVRLNKLLVKAIKVK